ncbi:hypothetical protein [Micromonospora sp. RV43]|uniref:hypothetical protein n=1 Tax=Micromonospora sp. RV43 TaxID=1661387 RepID=UPI00064BCEF6|nr:hypothetical protein [Micromonospora sp. RV43]
MHVTTIVATVALGDVAPQLADWRVRAALADLGVALVPCRWAPDPDTIAECAGADKATVLDLNEPPQLPAAGAPSVGWLDGLISALMELRQQHGNVRVLFGDYDGEYKRLGYLPVEAVEHDRRESAVVLTY